MLSRPVPPRLASACPQILRLGSRAPAPRPKLPCRLHQQQPLLLTSNSWPHRLLPRLPVHLLHTHVPSAASPSAAPSFTRLVAVFRNLVTLSPRRPPLPSSPSPSTTTTSSRPFSTRGSLLRSEKQPRPDSEANGHSHKDGGKRKGSISGSGRFFNDRSGGGGKGPAPGGPGSGDRAGRPNGNQPSWPELLFPLAMLFALNALTDNAQTPYVDQESSPSFRTRAHPHCSQTPQDRARHVVAGLCPQAP